MLYNFSFKQSCNTKIFSCFFLSFIIIIITIINYILLSPYILEIRTQLEQSTSGFIFSGPQHFSEDRSLGQLERNGSRQVCLISQSSLEDFQSSLERISKDCVSGRQSIRDTLAKTLLTLPGSLGLLFGPACLGLVFSIGMSNSNAPGFSTSFSLALSGSLHQQPDYRT